MSEVKQFIIGVLVPLIPTDHFDAVSARKWASATADVLISALGSNGLHIAPDTACRPARNT